MKARDLALLLCGLASPVAAQDLGRTVELPAHRALMDTVAHSDLAPFETDGCSGGLSSSWELVADTFPSFAEAVAENPPWEACCVTHDRAYHDAGGADDAGQSYDARLQADRALQACVVQNGEDQMQALIDQYDVSEDTVLAAYRNIAGAMYLAVRFGGGPCSGLPWRWGFGYGHCDPFGWTGPVRD